jgi:hypothetical protein
MSEKKKEDSRVREPRRRRRDDDDDETMAAEPPDSIAAMLDAVKPTERPWTVHKGTSVYYHADACDVCKEYTRHLRQDQKDGNPSLDRALEELERYWGGKLRRSKELVAEIDEIEDEALEKGFQRGYEKRRKDEEARRSKMGREHSLDTQRTATTVSSSGSQARPSKGKQPMTATEWELDAANREVEDLRWKYAQATAEISRLRRENDELHATIRSRVLEDTQSGAMEVDYTPMPRPALGGAGTASRSSTQTQPTRTSATTYASVATDAHKRKAAELDSAVTTPKKSKAPRVLLVDSRTGLPLPMGREGLMHFSGGPWAQFTLTAPGETLDAKVDWLLGRRYLPMYREVLNEIDDIRRHKGHLHPLQRRISNQRSEPFSLYEIAMRCPDQAPKGLRWANNEPNAVDMTVWEILRTIQRSSPKPERNLMLRQTLHDTVLDHTLWQKGATQSTGIRPTAYPELFPISMGNMAAHLRQCGVTSAFWREQIRPFVLRGMAPSATIAPTSTGSTVEPGQIITPAAASQLAQETPTQSPDVSVASTPPVARTAGRARTLSAPPAPTRAASSTTVVEPTTNDEDVPMDASEVTTTTATAGSENTANHSS